MDLRVTEVYVPTINREELARTEITLDGSRASICGFANDFATIRTLDGKWSGEWSWDAVERIVLKGGKFFL